MHASSIAKEAAPGAGARLDDPKPSAAAWLGHRGCLGHRVAVPQPKREWPRRILWLALIVALLMTPGCGGCRRDKNAVAEQERKEKEEKEAAERAKKEQPKPDFEFRALNTKPYGADRVERAVKPGHWTSGALDAVAHNFDFQGQLATAPLDLEDMPFSLGTSRPLILPKGQKRTVDLLFFYPVGRPSPATIVTRLSRRSGGREVHVEQFGALRQPAHQFYFVVLSREPDRYGFLSTFDTVCAPRGELIGPPGAENHYRLISVPPKSRSALPDNPLAWTNIAVLWWDDFDADQLSPAAQQALVDWLHWGGQLIVSGPTTLGELRETFLAPYLPAETAGTLDLTAEALKPFFEAWSTTLEPLKQLEPWSGEKLTLAPDAQVLVMGADTPLVAERRVGRGRVVVSAFHLNQRELRDWPGYDAFVHGCLLRRAPRRFQASEQTTDGVVFAWADDGASPRDATRVSQLRYFTRDAGERGPWHEYGTQIDPAQQALNSQTPNWPPPSGYLQPDEEATGGPGVAGWNDHSSAANAARDSLRSASGIDIPDAWFVVRVLAIYLVILVPVNWGVCRALGHVEWAWAVAPLIAVVGAVSVVWAAQLDIGFVRATNELAVIELQPHYPRAHVTRYTGLYASLSTRYDVHLADPSSLILPFPDGNQLLRGQSRVPVVLHRDEDVHLENFRVSSNSIGLLHSEHMAMLDGPLRIEPVSARQSPNESARWQLTNDTALALEGVAVLRDDAAAWFDQLAPGETKVLDFAFDPASEAWGALRERSPATSTVPEPGTANLRELVKLAEATRERGEWRLVAWSSEELPGIKIRPTASQTRQVNLVVAHLRYGPLGAPERDFKTRAAVEAEHALRTRTLREAEGVNKSPG